MKVSRKRKNRGKHPRIIYYIFPSNFNMLLTKEEDRIRNLRTILIFLSSCLAVSIFYYGILLYMPYSTAEAYIKCLNSKDYDKALKFYIDVPDSMFINDESISSSLKDEYESISKISIKSVSLSSKPKIYDVNLNLIKGSQKYTGRFSLYNIKSSLGGLKREWKVLFPLKVQDVIVKGPDGSFAFVDGINAGVIQNGALDIKKVISGKHEFKAVIPEMAASGTVNFKVDELNNNIVLELKPEEGFRNDMENLISLFCKGWSEYCLSRKPESIKPYLTSELFDEYISDTDMFYGSKYEKCEYAVEFKEMVINSRDDISLRVDERWHLTEAVIVYGLVFKANDKTRLEQNQYISWNYHIVRESGVWKIGLADQLEFRQEIIK